MYNNTQHATRIRRDTDRDTARDIVRDTSTNKAKDTSRVSDTAAASVICKASAIKQ